MFPQESNLLCLDFEIEVNHKVILIQIRVEEGTLEGRAHVNLTSDLPLRPLDIELALYEAAHVLAVSTNTEAALQKAKSIWT